MSVYEPPTDKCEVCRYFNSASTQCRRFPPIPLSLVYVQGNGNCTVEYHFPYMGGEEWCGEFKRKEGE